MDLLLTALGPSVVDPAPTALRRAAGYTEAKDAPLVAAAIAAKVDYFVTLHKRQLTGAPAVVKLSGLRIVRAGAVLAALKG